MLFIYLCVWACVCTGTHREIYIKNISIHTWSTFAYIHLYTKIVCRCYKCARQIYWKEFLHSNCISKEIEKNIWYYLLTIIHVSFVNRSYNTVHANCTGNGLCNAEWIILKTFSTIQNPAIKFFKLVVLDTVKWSRTTLTATTTLIGIHSD